MLWEEGLPLNYRKIIQLSSGKAYCIYYKYILISAIICYGVNGHAQELKFVAKTNLFSQNLSSKNNAVAVADYDLDGDLDLFVVNADSYHPNKESTWSTMYKNEGDGTYTDITSWAGLKENQYRTNSHLQPGYMGEKMGVAWGDYNKDNYPDLLLTNRTSIQLFENMQDGKFTEVTSASGLSSHINEMNYYSSPVWLDFDNDGDLDVYISNWALENRLYENNGNGYFSLLAERGVEDEGKTWTSLIIDANDDGYVDIYAINDFGENKFYENQGDGYFIEKTGQYGLENAGEGMGGEIADVNNDGLFDIYLTNISYKELNPLFINIDGNGFQEAAVEMGLQHADWAWGCKFFDGDHDSDLDLYV